MTLLTTFVGLSLHIYRLNWGITQKLDSNLNGLITILTCILALFYTYFIFTSERNINYYWVIDLLALLLLIYYIFNSKKNTLFIIALIWLACNYLFNIKTNCKIWNGYDGFTVAVLLSALY